MHNNEETLQRCEEDRENKETDIWHCEDCGKEECICGNDKVLKKMNDACRPPGEGIRNFMEAAIWGGIDKIPPCLKN